MVRKDVEEILKKYRTKLELEVSSGERKSSSKEYSKFKEEIIPKLSFYERWCKNLGGVLKFKVSEKDKEKLSKSIKTAHLDITPAEASGLAIISMLLVLVLDILIALISFLITGTLSENIILFFLLTAFVSFFVYFYLENYPKILAQRWRLKTSSQMVPCILYVVVYMRHTSNLERAIKFASEHLQDPLARDLKKIFWNVQTGKYSTIKESLDVYLESWRDYSLEFVEAFHLIEGSLYEPSETRRIEFLEKSLEVMLDGVYEKMLKYTHEAKNPLTNVYMLGIILPTLALALLPLASTLMGGVIKSIHIFLLFNLIVPFFVFYLTNNVLAKRPGGYGEAEEVKGFKKKNRKALALALLIAVPLLIIGLLPLLFQYTPLFSAFGLEKGANGLRQDVNLGFLGVESLRDTNLFDYKINQETGKIVGPFGFFSVLLGLFVPLSIAAFFIVLYKEKIKGLLKIRKETKLLEKQFSSSLFQLGSRLGDNLPAEVAFGKVAYSLSGTPTGEFFSLVNSNIQQVGMSVDEAIFNKKRGAILYFPSPLIRTSMRILIESVKKGLKVAARAMMSISNYVKNINKIQERLEDLLADIISSMKSNMRFLAPLLAGIIMGLSAMITTILGKLYTMFTSGAITAETSLGALGNAGNLLGMLDVTKTIPPYFLQISIGIYIIQIVFILSATLVGIKSGVDKLGNKSEIASNLKSSIVLYFFVSFISILALTLLAGFAVKGFVPT